ncbi:PE-PPE domain-containing protein [Mycolicibacterium psychrotolerans]|uniref:PE-PPE domain-containing protein n=1 Tax=Mycolicibacterium psychrotolerans TaxID=216929 RepID=UPI003D674349
MKRSRLMRAAKIAVLVCAIIVIGLGPEARAQAQTRITVPGAGPLYYPNFVAKLPLGRLYFFGTNEASGPPLSILAGYDLLNHQIAENWFPGTTAQVVNYPASMGLLSFNLAAPGVDDAVAMGRSSLDDQIRNAVAGGDPVVVAALSEGTLVVNRELAKLATSSNAPPADLVSFAMYASPELGFASIYLPVGAWVPLMKYTAHDLADSQYDVSVVFHQYDFWGDPPDRPWNLLAMANSLAGMAYFHDATPLASMSDAVVVSKVTSDLGGTTTTFMIPSPTLALLKPLQQLGMPRAAVDALNSVLKPIVDSGYSRLTPAAGPYVSHGRLAFKPRAATTGQVVRGSRIAGPRERVTSTRRPEAVTERSAAPPRTIGHRTPERSARAAS